MVRRPWLRRTRLLAGAPPWSVSASGRPLWEGAAALGFGFFLADLTAVDPLVAFAGSRRTLGDLMREKS